jgi:WD40 repeat protein
MAGMASSRAATWLGWFSDQPWSIWATTSRGHVGAADGGCLLELPRVVDRYDVVDVAVDHVQRWKLSGAGGVENLGGHRRGEHGDGGEIDRVHRCAEPAADLCPGASRHPTGELIATAPLAEAASQNVEVWDATTGERVASLAGHTGAVHDLTFDADGSRLATVSADGTTRLDFDELVAIAERKVTRHLTDDDCRQYLHTDRCIRRATSTADDRTDLPASWLWIETAAARALHHDLFSVARRLRS